MPTFCACGNKFNLSHAMLYKKGGLVSLRHNEIRNIYPDVRQEPSLIQLENEQFNERTAAKSDESRLDVSALGFWITGQQVFCDVRVFDLNAQRYRETELKNCYKKNEDEKKKKYNERVLQVENGSFTPLVFSTHGGMGRECKKFYQRLAELIAAKRNITVSMATTYVRTRICFSLLRSMLLCLRGSRTPRKTPDDLTEVDMSFVNSISVIRET